MVNLSRKIEQWFPGALLDFLRAAAKLASAEGQALYLVGGAVRDLLLGRPNLDLDLVVEGDALLLARRLAEQSGGDVVTHRRFRTAKLRWGQLTIDLATARSEIYARPGALPTVQPGSISDDLFRRDFSVNAMAIELNPASFGNLVDPYGGKSDLERGLLRVLHEKSFIDDPTRMLRALRYEQRLGFRLEGHTEELLHQAITVMDNVTGERLRHELELILNEDHPERILSRADELGVLARLHPSLQGNGWLTRKFDQARQASGSTKPRPDLYLLLLAYRLTQEEIETFINRLKPSGKVVRAIRDTLHLKTNIHALAEPDLKPSSIYDILKHHSPQAILTVAIASENLLVRQHLQLYLKKLRYVRPSLSGDDLRRMGVPSGIQLGQILQALHEAKLDRRVKTRSEEESLVRRWLANGEVY